MKAREHKPLGDPVVAIVQLVDESPNIGMPIAKAFVGLRTTLQRDLDMLLADSIEHANKTKSPAEREWYLKGIETRKRTGTMIMDGIKRIEEDLAKRGIE